jgi:hypothetical protein
VDICIFEDCSNPRRGRQGYCNAHYIQSRSGRPLQPAKRHDETPEDRFLEKISKASADGCWTWTGARNDRGYGQIRIKGKIHYAHRLAYEEAYGAIPLGLVIDHLCHNPACVNPQHIHAVTSKQNSENLAGVRSRTGFRGVHKTRGGRFAAQVGHNGKKHFGGVFDTPEAAGQAASELRKRLFSNNPLDYRGVA